MAVNVNIPKPTYTKNDIGLGNVDNTSDLNKPISTAGQSALDLKVDKVTGKGLSTEDYTTAEKSKLAGIEAGAEVNVNADWNAISGDAQILNKPTIPSISGLVPYTGATADVDLDTFGLDAKFIKIKGTGGNGHLNLKHQSSGATAGGSESVLYADNSGNPKWKNDGNAVQDVMLGSAITQARLNLEIFEAKQVSATQTTTGTTPIAITELKVTPTINKRYSLTACIHLGCSGVGGVRIGITIPTGATIFITGFGTGVPESTNSIMSFINANNGFFVNPYVVSSSQNGMCIVHGEVEMGAIAGDVQFTFRSITGGQTSTVLKTGSFMKLEEI